MTCRSCGATIADKAIVCYRCGTATADPASLEPRAVVPARRRSRLLTVVVAAVAALAALTAWLVLSG
jgi:hypothetical protein